MEGMVATKRVEARPCGDAVASEQVAAKADRAVPVRWKGVGPLRRQKWGLVARGEVAATL